MWHYAPLRTQARGHLLWFTAWLAMRKTWINYSLCYCDGFLSSIYLLISTYYLYITHLFTHIFIYTPYIKTYDRYKYMSNIYVIPIQILEDKWNNRSRRRRFPFHFWLCLLQAKRYWNKLRPSPCLSFLICDVRFIPVLSRKGIEWANP